MKAHLKMIGILDTWYTSALHRSQWDSLYVERVHSSHQLLRETLPTVHCSVCGRTFCREQDRARHKPVHQQQGALQCFTCERWFRSKGGLAVHNCCEVTPAYPVDSNITEHVRTSSVDSKVHCSLCQQTFN